MHRAQAIQICHNPGRRNVSGENIQAIINQGLQVWHECQV